MRCDEVMKTDVVRVDPADTVQVAARRMRDANVGFVPVCDGAGRVLGTLTDRDITLRVVAEGRSAAACSVADVMTRDVISCRGADGLGHAEALMGQHRKSRMLVTSDDGVLQGVLSLSDIARLEGPRRTAATIREITSRETRL